MVKEKIQPELRNVCVRLGFTLIIQNLLIMTLYSGAAVVFSNVCPEPTETQYVIGNMIEGAFYLFSFMFPVLLFRLMMKKFEWQPMRLGIKTGPDTVLAIPFGMSVVFASATLNSLLFSWADMSVLMAGESYDTPIKIMVNFVTMALIPAVAEEFLFRGCVLSNLLPFGKTTAVIGSAVLFALMHSNPIQFLYAFCAGIVLGLLYAESGSIWPGMFLHLINNFFSVFQEAAYGIYPPETADKIVLIASLAVILAGLAAGTLLIIRRKGKIAADDGGAEPTFRSTEKFTMREFCRPSMVVSSILNIGEGVFILICLLIM